MVETAVAGLISITKQKVTYKKVFIMFLRRYWVFTSLEKEFQPFILDCTSNTRYFLKHHVGKRKRSENISHSEKNYKNPL